MSQDPIASSRPIRRRMLVSGRVQGVGFRYTTERVADRFAVTGFVRNLRDGRVEVLAEGTAAEIDRFIEAVGDAMEGHIDSLEVSQTTATGEFTRFSVAV